MIIQKGGIHDKAILPRLLARSGQISGGLFRTRAAGWKTGALAIVVLYILFHVNFSFAGDEVPNTNPYHDDPSPEEICDECYRENREEFQAFLESIVPFEGTLASELERVDDFYISRVGVMIHEGCFEKDFDRVQDFEQMVTDAIVRGLTCISRGDRYYRERMDSNVTSAYNHMPRFLNLLNNNNLADQDPQIDLAGPDGSRHTRNLNCGNYRSVLLHADQFPIHDDCEEIRTIPNLPKIFCDQDNVEKAKDFDSGSINHFSSDGARGTLPHGNRPIVKNYKGKTKIYTGPAIFLNADALKSRPRGQIQSTVFHELFHNLGYEHEHRDHDGNIVFKGHNDYAYACQAACFYSEFAERLGRNGIGEMNAAALCFNNKYNSNNHSEESYIQDAIARSYLDN